MIFLLLGEFDLMYKQENNFCLNLISRMPEHYVSQKLLKFMASARVLGPPMRLGPPWIPGPPNYRFDVGTSCDRYPLQRSTEIKEPLTFLRCPFFSQFWKCWFVCGLTDTKFADTSSFIAWHCYKNVMRFYNLSVVLW